MINMDDNRFASEKSSELVKSHYQNGNAQQRLKIAEANLNFWQPEFKLTYPDTQVAHPVIQARIGGKMVYANASTQLLDANDEINLTKQLAAELETFYGKLMMPFIAALVSKAITNYNNAKKLEGGKL